MKENSALIVVDVQVDFLPGGAVAVASADEIIDVINCIRDEFPIVIFTQDIHPPNHISFASTHAGRSPFEKVDLEMRGYSGSVQTVRTTVWPDHCVAGSPGAEIDPRLIRKPTDIIVQKGMLESVESYSAFMDLTGASSTRLADELRAHDIRHCFVVGVASEHCVYSTARDACRLGYDVTLVQDACRGISPDDVKARWDELRNVGVTVVNSQDL